MDPFTMFILSAAIKQYGQHKVYGGMAGDNPYLQDKKWWAMDSDQARGVLGQGQARLSRENLDRASVEAFNRERALRTHDFSNPAAPNPLTDMGGGVANMLAGAGTPAQGGGLLDGVAGAEEEFFKRNALYNANNQLVGNQLPEGTGLGRLPQESVNALIGQEQTGYDRWLATEQRRAKGLLVDDALAESGYIPGANFNAQFATTADTKAVTDVLASGGGSAWQTHNELRPDQQISSTTMDAKSIAALTPTPRTAGGGGGAAGLTPDQLRKVKTRTQTALNYTGALVNAPTFIEKIMQNVLFGAPVSTASHQQSSVRTPMAATADAVINTAFAAATDSGIDAAIWQIQGVNKGDTAAVIDKKIREHFAEAQTMVADFPNYLNGFTGAQHHINLTSIAVAARESAALYQDGSLITDDRTASQVGQAVLDKHGEEVATLVLDWYERGLLPAALPK